MIAVLENDLHAAWQRLLAPVMGTLGNFESSWWAALGPAARARLLRDPKPPVICVWIEPWPATATSVVVLRISDRDGPLVARVLLTELLADAAPVIAQATAAPGVH